MIQYCLYKYALIYRNFTKKSVHGERITVEQQATDNKSDVVKDLVAGLDSKGM